MVKQSDIVLCNIPFMSVAYAPAGTSLLKACLQEKGFISWRGLELHGLFPYANSKQKA